MPRADDHLNTPQWVSINRLDWSEPRLIHELRNGLAYRTFPPGITIDWRDPRVQGNLLDMETSTVAAGTIPRTLGTVGGAIDDDTPTVIGIEVQLPASEPTVAAPGVAKLDAGRAPSVTAARTQRPKGSCEMWLKNHAPSRQKDESPGKYHLRLAEESGDKWIPDTIANALSRLRRKAAKASASQK